MVAVGNGPSFGGGLRITEGAVLDDGLLDVVVIRPMSQAASCCRPTRSCSRAPTSTTPTTGTTTRKRVTIAAPGITAYADGERIARAAPDGGGRAAGAARPGAVTPHASLPSEQYAQFRRKREHPMLADFASPSRLRARRLPGARLPRARGRHGRCWSRRPTGSGKTIVGEFAVHLALESGRKAFYTTPIKALSNQKFNDLVERYGAEQGRSAHRRQHASTARRRSS